MILFYIPCVLLALVMQLRIQIICCKLNFAFCCYASRRSRTRDTVKLTVCLFQLSLLNGCNAMKTNRASSHVLLDFDSLICKLKLCSRVMTTLTYSEGCCCLFRILCSIICSHKLSIQPMT